MNMPLFLLGCLLVLCIGIIYFLYRKNVFFRKKIIFQKTFLNEITKKNAFNENSSLHQSPYSYQKLILNTSDIIFFQDIDANFTYLTDSCQLITGFSKTEFIGRSVFDFFHPKDVSKVRKAYFSLINDSYMKPIEFRFLKKDGTYFWVEGVASILSDENKGLLGIVTSIREIDERKKAENELLKYKARIEALLKNSSDSIWSIDKNFKLISFNNTFIESFKLFYDFSPYLGMSILKHFNDGNKAIWIDYYTRALNGEHFTAEVTENSLGLRLCFEISFNPIYIKSVITGVAVFSRDITSRKNVENQLEYKINELNTFVYKASHDLRSPLVSVIGLVELAKSENDIYELEQYLRMIGVSVRKMDNLLIDLVKIVNVSQGKLAKDKIDFDWTIEEILNSLTYRPDFSKIIFRKHMNVDTDYFADSALLYSILQNIIDNAIKYKKANNLIEHLIIITIDVNTDKVKISITDNGMGIPEDSIGKVFDMFYRATSESTGTGLGLYIVKTSVEKMGGKIELNSIYEKGTNVNIVIPNNSSS